MRILISTGYLDEELNAGTKIAIEIAKNLILKGYSCKLCGISKEKKKTEKSINEDITCHYFVRDFSLPTNNIFFKLENYLSKEKSKAIGKLKFCIFHPVTALKIVYSMSPLCKTKMENPLYQEYADYTQKLIKEYNADAVICLQEPFYPMQAIINKNEINCAKIIYQLDPWGFHRLDEVLNSTQEQRMTEEIEVFNKAKHIFTTPILYALYDKDEKYKSVLDKITAIEFPAIKKNDLVDNCPINYQDSFINILFCGTLNDNYRSPEKFLVAITNLIEKGNKIKVYFLGLTFSQSANMFAEKYPQNIIIEKQVLFPQAISAMQNADILLNVGNSIDNQVPSKIFDYFSLGKPIIHVKKIENCASQQYVDRYPWHFTFKDYENNNENALLEFINSCKSKNISFSDIESIYFTATPNYVVNKIYDILQK